MKKSPSSPEPSPPLYSQEILQLGEKHGKGTRLQTPDISAEDVGALCGSRIIVDIAWDTDKTIKNIGYRVDACALGTASAGIFASVAPGCDHDTIKEIHSQLKNMLQGDDFCFKTLPAREDFSCEDFSLLQAAKLYPSRHAAILLPVTATLKAFAT